MDDLNATSSSTTSAGHPLRDSQGRTSRNSHIRFPQTDDISHNVQSSHGGSSPSSSVRIPLQNSIRRRRIHSTETSVSGDHARNVVSSSPGPSGGARVSPSAVRHSHKDRLEIPGKLLETYGQTAFSDEYELSQDDPNVLEDVQRVLRLRAKRESRLKGLASLSASPPAERKSLHPEGSGSAFPPVTFPILSSSGHEYNVSSDIDFSPSVGIEGLHPVPATSDDGVTLDWSIPTSEDEKTERRWRRISATKRKGKERATLTPGDLERQKTAFSDKILRIKSKASPRTMQKVALINDQFRRRYHLMFNSPLSEKRPLDIARVSRWYRSLDPPLQIALIQAESMQWLKHIWDRRSPSPRISWYLSAFIIEEYITTHKGGELVRIPENRSLEVIVPSEYSSPPFPVTPQLGSRSQMTSPNALSLSASGKRSSEGQGSRERFGDSTRSSLDDGLRPEIAPPLRHSLPVSATSPHSSIHSLFSNSSNYYGRYSNAASPSSSRLHLRDIPRRVARGAIMADSDGGSSTRESLSDYNARSDDGAVERGGRVSKARPLTFDSMSSHPGHGSDYEGTNGSVNLLEPIRLRNHQNKTLSIPNPPLGTVSEGEPTAVPKLSPARSVGHPAAAAAATATATPRLPAIRRVRISLPSVTRISMDEEDKRQQEEDAALERSEYELKSQILEQTTAQNTRIRYLLQRVAKHVKEYEVLQTRLSGCLNFDFHRIPNEVLDAFSHDPSHVTGATRRSAGYHAVEDIHERTLRQQQIIRSYLANVRETGVCPEPHPNVLENPMSFLSESLDAIESSREELLRKAQEVAETLSRVKGLHATVKQEYNETLSHTSAVYPELSQIVVLEENYRDQYQQFWELGMDALTLLLDTVTPFWRNYGKIIGVDVQDFLIIPLYRHEFTGEPKRYPITRLPKRSLKHWMGLLLFCCLTFLLALLQIRAAFESTLYYHMPFITHPGLWWMLAPFFWTIVFIQWCAVLLESCICLTELGVIVWWFGWAFNIFT